MERKRRSGVLVGAVAGALGGITASWAMLQFNKALGGADAIDVDRHRRHATPNDMDATISDRPASIKVAENVAATVADTALDEREQDVGGTLVHYLFGATTGALYGIAAERNPGAASFAGMPFGIAVWLAADEIGLPVLGLARNPATYPATRHVASFGSHLVFGLTTDVVRRGASALFRTD